MDLQSTANNSEWMTTEYNQAASTTAWMASAFSSIHSPPTESSSFEQEPKKKAGRKHAVDQPKNKRTAQNRASQRAFRERKGSEKQALVLENDELKATIEELRLEIAALKENAGDVSYFGGVEYNNNSMQNQIGRLDTSVLDSFGTQYRGEGEERETYSNTMDELFDLLKIPLPIESEQPEVDPLPKVNVDELCDMFKIKARCEELKGVKKDIKDAWDRGDKEEVYHLVGDLNAKCDAFELKG